MLLDKATSFNKQTLRIISLVPSQTELLYHLGLEEEVAGITKFCIHPDAWHKAKPRIGGTKNINISKIKNLSPTLIIANKEENVKEQITLLAHEYDVWVTDVNNLQDALQMITDIGVLTQKEINAQQITQSILQKFEQLHPLPLLKKAIYLIWKNPFMTIGGDTFISNMMLYAGFKNVFDTNTRYPTITVEDIRKSGAEYLLLSTEPYPFSQQHVNELQAQLTHIKVILVDGEMFSWYGSRLLIAADYFEKIKKTDFHVEPK
ncbi:MAG: ABC transporter substrate-binding protein [Bacteroidetes bacterium]|nr:ABC transporter substrate-binding protein [Bacteroidota bacterium]